MAHKQQKKNLAKIYEFFIVQRTFNARNFGSISAFLYIIATKSTIHWPMLTFLFNDCEFWPNEIIIITLS